MCAKENGFCLFFIYTITSLPAGGWCEAPPPTPTAHLAPGGAHLQGFYLGTGHGSQTRPSGGRGPEPRPREWTDSSFDPEDCGRGEVHRVVHGTFSFIAQPEVDRPSEEARSGPGQRRWRRLQPVVECGDAAMTLTFRRRLAEQLQLDTGNVSRPPPGCGSSLQASASFLSLTVRFDGCHVTQEGGRWLLPLRWRGTSVQASCPVSRTRPGDAGPPALCCSPSGFAVALPGPSAAEQLRVNVAGRWTALGLLAQRCGFALARRRAGVVLTVPFAACGVAVEDGRRALTLQRGEEAFTLSCPIAPAGSRGLREAPPRLPWAPPFYLAPLFHPHPTRVSERPSPAWTPDAAFDAQLLLGSWVPPQIHVRQSNIASSSTDGTTDSSLDEGDPGSLHASVPESSSSLTEAPSLQRLGHGLSPYYYHHPNVPVSSPDPGPHVAEQPTNPPSREIPACVQQWDVSDQLPHPSPPRFHHTPLLSSSETNTAAETNVSHVFLFPPENHMNRELRNAEKRRLFPEEEVTADRGRPGPALRPHPGASEAGLHPPHSYHFYPFYLHGPAASRVAGLHPSPASTGLHYYHYFLPEATAEDQDPGSQVHADDRRMDQVTRAGEVGNDRPQTLNRPVHSFLPHYVSVLRRPSGGTGRKPSTRASCGSDSSSPVNPSSLLFVGPDRPEANARPAPACAPGSPLDCARSLGCCSYRVHDCTVGQRLVLVLPDRVLHPTPAPVRPSEGNASCSLEKLTSDPGVYTAPLLGCGVARRVFGDTVVHLLEVRGFHARRDQASAPSPVRLMVECRSSPGSPGEVRLHVMDQLPPPPPAQVTVQLRVSSDPSFGSYHPEAHLPLSLLRGRLLYLEVRLLDPADPDLVLLVHSCVAHAPFLSWMPVYDGCSSHSDSQLLPVPHPPSHHIWRIAVFSFTSLPPESPPPPLEDPEIYFLCLTEVCSSSDDGCSISCANGPDSEQ